MLNWGKIFELTNDIITKADGGECDEAVVPGFMVVPILHGGEDSRWDGHKHKQEQADESHKLNGCDQPSGEVATCQRLLKSVHEGLHLGVELGADLGKHHSTQWDTHQRKGDGE